MLNDITQAELKDMFDYDVENGWLIRKRDNKPVGHKPNTTNGYSHIGINGKNYRTHRLIWLWHKGTWPSKFIDHIDQDRMNNRIENLREADAKTNQHNQKILKNNTSGFPGVSWINRDKKYQVKIQTDGKTKVIGTYDNLESAILAAKIAKIKYHPTSPISKKYIIELTKDGINVE